MRRFLFKYTFPINFCDLLIIASRFFASGEVLLCRNHGLKDRRDCAPPPSHLPPLTIFCSRTPAYWRRQCTIGVSQVIAKQSQSHDNFGAPSLKSSNKSHNDEFYSVGPRWLGRLIARLPRISLRAWWESARRGALFGLAERTDLLSLFQRQSSNSSRQLQCCSIVILLRYTDVDLRVGGMRKALLRP